MNWRGDSSTAAGVFHQADRTLDYLAGYTGREVVVQLSDLVVWNCDTPAGNR